MIFDVGTSKKIEPFPSIRLGSSSTDGEDKDLLNLDYFMTKSHYPIGYYLTYDVASHFESVFPIVENETYKSKEIIPEEMLEHDIVVKMPPKRKFSIKARITCIRKAEPRIVIPENPYTGI